ncbi:hypothetical protein TI03_02745 [Achromatium sp. WMS1]|nr:hypothetical protein TI03_02745 [Achromatium sp. WMS1]
MKNTINPFLIIILLTFFTQSHAGLAYITNWNGTWHDNNGGIISIRENDGFLKITGKDKASIYTCTCLVTDNNVAKCFGEGVNYLKNFRFLYQSTISGSRTGKLYETWKALLKYRTLRGKTTFIKYEPR